MNWIVVASVLGGAGLVFLWGIRIVQQTERGLKERMGKYVKFCTPGFHWVLPLIEHIRLVNVTEQMVNAEKREIITEDKLNAMVDAQVYFRVKATEDAVKASQYEVSTYAIQIVALAKTTLRNIIGNLTLTEANSDRQKINGELEIHLARETAKWGIEIVRTELKEIDPPKDVQETMNNVVKAENQKVAAKDFAIAKETEADGQRMAAIKVAEGEKKARVLRAEGEAEAITLVNTAAKETLTGAALELRKLEALERTLAQGTKILLPTNQPLINVIGDLMKDGSA